MGAIYEFLEKIPPIIPQIIGITGTVLYILCFQLKHRIGIILMNAASRLLFVIQYCLLGAFAGAILDILGICAAFIATKKDVPFIKKRIKWVFIATVLFIAAGGALSIFLALNGTESITPWIIILSVLPTFGVLLHSSAFFLTEEKKIRILSLTGSPFWLVYNFASKAYGSCVGDILSMVSIVSAMIRYRKQNKESSDSSVQI